MDDPQILPGKKDYVGGGGQAHFSWGGGNLSTLQGNKKQGEKATPFFFSVELGR